MLAILGGLGAATAWAVAGLCSSRSSRRLDPLVVIAWMMLIGLLISAPLAAVAPWPSAAPTSAFALLTLAGVGNLVALLAFYRALRLGDVSIVAPLVSTEGMIAAIIAILFGRSVSAWVALTLLIITAGAVLASLPRERQSPAERSVHRRVIFFASLAALAGGTSLYAAGRAGSELPSSYIVLAARLAGTLVVTLPLARRGRLPWPGRVMPLVVVSGVAEVLGFYAFNAGARHGLAVASVMASQFATVAAIAAVVIFGERMSRAQLAGVSTVSVGVAALSALQP